MFSSLWRKRKNTTNVSDNMTFTEFEKDCEIISTIDDQNNITNNSLSFATKAPKIETMFPPSVTRYVEPDTMKGSLQQHKSHEIQCFNDNIRNSIIKFIHCID